MMNDSRYKLRGATHKKGTEGTSRQMWLVVANSKTEAKAGNSSHDSRRSQDGAGSSSVTFWAPASAAGDAADSAPARSRAVFQQAAVHSTANSTKPAVQHKLCCRPSNSGSTTNG